MMDGSRPPQLNTTVCGCRCGCGCGCSANPDEGGIGSPISAAHTSAVQDGGPTSHGDVYDAEQADDAGSETASISDDHGIETHQVQTDEREIGDLGMFTQTDIQRSIARHQNGLCDCIGLTTGWSADSLSAGLGTGNQSMASSAYLPRIGSSNGLLSHMGGEFDGAEVFELPPPAVAMHLESPPDTGLGHLYPQALDLDGEIR